MGKFQALGGALVASVALVVSGCSPSPDPAPTSRSAPPPGSDPSTWAPLEVSPELDGEVVYMVVGQAATLVGMPQGMISVGSLDVRVVSPVQPSPAGATPESSGGFVAVGPGSTDVLIVYGSGEPLATVTVTVTG